MRDGVVVKRDLQCAQVHRQLAVLTLTLEYLLKLGWGNKGA